MSSLADEVRGWKWWDSDEWTAYCEANSQPVGRPVHGPSYVTDLTADPWRTLSKGHRSAIKVQMGTQHLRRVEHVAPFHLAHRAAAGRETRPQATWDEQQRWLDNDHATLLTNGVGGWAYVILDPPGAYYASAAGKDCHWLHFHLIEGLADSGFRWYELGEGHTPGIGTFKSGFASVLVEP